MDIVFFQEAVEFTNQWPPILNQISWCRYGWSMRYLSPVVARFRQMGSQSFWPRLRLFACARESHQYESPQPTPICFPHPKSPGLTCLGTTDHVCGCAHPRLNVKCVINVSTAVASQAYRANSGYAVECWQFNTTPAFAR